ncbi:hypothetical protein IA69_32645, partial [Massilia sp. JS1662]
MVVVGDDAMDLRAREVQRAGDLRHGIGGDVAERVLQLVQDRQQRAGLVHAPRQHGAHRGGRTVGFHGIHRGAPEGCAASVGNAGKPVQFIRGIRRFIPAMDMCPCRVGRLRYQGGLRIHDRGTVDE